MDRAESLVDIIDLMADLMSSPFCNNEGHCRKTNMSRDRKCLAWKHPTETANAAS